MTADDLIARGNTLLGDGDPDAAAACFDAALAIDPRRAEAHFGRGFASYQRGDNVQAVASLTTSIQQQPHAAAYILRCMARANLNDRRGAMDDYREAVSRDPRMSEVLQSQTCVGTAQIVVLATLYPSEFVRIANLLTRA